MIAQIAIAMMMKVFISLWLCLDLTILDVRCMAPIFLLVDHFPYWFSFFSKKLKKNYQLEVSIFCRCNIEFRSFQPFIFTCVTVSHASWRVKVCENICKIYTYWPNVLRVSHLTSSGTWLQRVQNMTMIVSLRWFTLDNFNYIPL